MTKDANIGAKRTGRTWLTSDYVEVLRRREEQHQIRRMPLSVPSQLAFPRYLRSGYPSHNQE